MESQSSEQPKIEVPLKKDHRGGLRLKSKIKNAAGSAFLAGILAACNPSGATETQKPTVLPSESAIPTKTAVPSETPNVSITPIETKSPTPTEPQSIYDGNIEIQQSERLKNWKISLLSESAQKIRVNIIKNADKNGFIDLGETKGAVIQYDPNDNSLQGQVSLEGNQTIVINGNNFSFTNGQIQAENFLRSQGFSQHDVCDIKLTWIRDPQVFPPKTGEKITTAPLSCFVDSTKIVLPETTP